MRRSLPPRPSLLVLAPLLGACVVVANPDCPDNTVSDGINQSVQQARANGYGVGCGPLLQPANNGVLVGLIDEDAGPDADPHDASARDQ